MRQVVVTALRRRTCEVRAILHAGKQSHSQGGVVHTEEGDVPYWAHCVSILRFLRKGKLSREEAKVWEGRNNGADGSEAVCARWQCDYAPRPSHTHISSPSYTLPSSLESFPSPKIRKMRNSQRQPAVSVFGGVVDSQQNTFAEYS